MTFYDESEQGVNPMTTKMVKNQVQMTSADEDLMSTTAKIYGRTKAPNLTPKKLSP